MQVQVLLSARKLREVHSGVWAADASLLAGRRITIRVYTAIAVGQAPRRGACMHFARKDNKSALSKDLLIIRVGLFCVLTSILTANWYVSCENLAKKHNFFRGNNRYKMQEIGIWCFFQKNL